jgi:hypothetical protein
MAMPALGRCGTFRIRFRCRIIEQGIDFADNSTGVPTAGQARDETAAATSAVPVRP